jgi:hypothetical protein
MGTDPCGARHRRADGDGKPKLQAPLCGISSIGHQGGISCRLSAWLPAITPAARRLAGNKRRRVAPYFATAVASACPFGSVVDRASNSRQHDQFPEAAPCKIPDEHVGHQAATALRVTTAQAFPSDSDGLPAITLAFRDQVLGSVESSLSEYGKSAKPRTDKAGLLGNRQPQGRTVRNRCQPAAW